MKKVGVILVTYDGVVNNYCGVGTSCIAFIHSFPEIRECFLKFSIDLQLHLVSPALSIESLGYSEKIKSESKVVTRKSGGEVHFISNGGDGMVAYGNIENWRIASVSAATKALEIATRYDQTLAFFLDTPFAHSPYYVETLKDVFDAKNITSIIVLQSDVLIHEPNNPSIDRLGWEASAIKYAELRESIKIADVGRFLTNHLIKNYGLDKRKFSPLSMGLDPKNKRFEMFSEIEIEKELKKYNIPLDKDLIFSVARAVDYKGFDILIRSFAQIKKPAHLVFVASPYKGEVKYVNELKGLINKLGISCTPKFDCDFYLPRIICQWRRTKVVAQLARHEPFGLVPEEVRLWSRKSGPVVLASKREGFLEQITDGVDGFLVDIEDDLKVAKKMDLILSLKVEKLKSIKENGLKTFKEKFDSRVAVFDSLEDLIPEARRVNKSSYLKSLTI